MSSDDKRADGTLWVVVTGDPLFVPVGLGELLSDVQDRALALRYGNSDGEWEMRNAKGEVLDLGVTVASLDLKWDDRLFLNLRAGIGA